MDLGGDTITKLGAVVISVRTEFRNNRGRRPHAKQQIFERVVLDEVELDVFIPLAFAGSGIGLAEQIQFRAAVGLRLSGGRVRDFGQLPGLIGVCGDCLVCRGFFGLLSAGCGDLDQ